MTATRLSARHATRARRPLDALERRRKRRPRAGVVRIARHLRALPRPGRVRALLHRPALIELLDVLVSMLFHDALVQRKEATDLHFDTAFTTSMLLAFALLGACWLFAPVFARVVHHPQAAGVLAWTALRFPFTALGAIIVARQRRALAFKVLALRSLVGRLCGAALGIGLVVLGAGVWGLVAQQVAIACAASLVLDRRGLAPAPALRPARAPRAVRVRRLRRGHRVRELRRQARVHHHRGRDAGERAGRVPQHRVPGGRRALGHRRHRSGSGQPACAGAAAIRSGPPPPRLRDRARVHLSAPLSLLLRNRPGRAGGRHPAVRRPLAGERPSCLRAGAAGAGAGPASAHDAGPHRHGETARRARGPDGRARRHSGAARDLRRAHTALGGRDLDGAQLARCR